MQNIVNNKSDYLVINTLDKNNIYEIAKKENRKPVEVALAWLLQKKGITALK